jgi:hypothetical protein
MPTWPSWGDIVCLARRRATRPRGDDAPVETTRASASTSPAINGTLRSAVARPTSVSPRRDAAGAWRTGRRRRAFAPLGTAIDTARTRQKGRSSARWRSSSGAGLRPV